MTDVNNNIVPLQVCIMPEYIYKALDGNKKFNLDRFSNIVFRNYVGSFGSDDRSMGENTLEPLDLIQNNREQIKEVAKWMLDHFSKADILDFFVCNTAIYNQLFMGERNFRPGLSALASELCDNGLAVSLGDDLTRNSSLLQDFLSLYMTPGKSECIADKKLISMRKINETDDGGDVTNHNYHIAVENDVLFIIPANCFGKFFTSDLKSFREQLSSEILDTLVAYYGEERALKSNVFKLWNNICNL